MDVKFDGITEEMLAFGLEKARMQVEDIRCNEGCYFGT